MGEGGDWSELEEGGGRSEMGEGGCQSGMGEGGCQSDMGEGGCRSAMGEAGCRSEMGEGGCRSEMGEGGCRSDMGEGGCRSDMGEDGCRWSEGCSLHVVALLDSIWIDKLHRLSLPTGKWAQLPFFGPASHWNPQSGWHYSYSKRETLRATQAPKMVNSPPLP